MSTLGLTYHRYIRYSTLVLVFNMILPAGYLIDKIRWISSVRSRLDDTNNDIDYSKNGKRDEPRLAPWQLYVYHILSFHHKISRAAKSITILHFSE